MADIYTRPFYSQRTIDRAKAIIAAARADGLRITVRAGGNAVDLLLDNMGELDSADDARQLCGVLTDNHGVAVR